jgi:hypothetical protein
MRVGLTQALDLMTNSDLFSLFIVVTVASTVIAFVLSLAKTGAHLGSTYRGAVIDAWLRVLGALMLVIIYGVISMARGGWEQIFLGPELSASALVILFMSCQELCLGLGVKHSWSITSERLGMLGGWALLWLIAATVSVVLIYQTAPAPLGTVIWQIILLLVAVLTYFCTAVPVRLLRAGYVPKPHKV